MLKNATLEALSGKPPILLEGKCTQAVLQQFEVAFDNYCSLKQIESKNHMSIAVGCFRDHHITDWLTPTETRAKVLAMTFPNFMAELRKRVLPSAWERDTRLAMNMRRQQPDESFVDFQTAIRFQNSLLMNTDSHLEDDRVRNLLETNMLTELQEDYAADARAKDEDDFTTWLDEVQRVNDQRTRTNARLHSIAKAREHECDRKRNATNDGNSDRPPKRNGGNNSGNKREGTPASTSGPSGSSVGCPQLTLAEKDLLNANHGCRRCRKPFVKHALDKEKTCEFPPAANYKPVTQATVNAALATLSPELRRHFDLPPKTPAPATLNTVAAVLPDVEDPDDSGTADSDLSTRVSTPHRSPHLFWDFRMDGPMSNLPIPIRGLIDDGSHLVLIHPRLIEHLALRVFKLHTPEEVGTALDPSELKPTQFTHYVKFKAWSEDSSWESNTVRAVVAPGLCVDVILGLPWLERNHIVIDHHLRTVVDKQTNYNLLDPKPLPPPKPPLIKLRDKLKKTKTDHKLLATELRAVCAARLERLTAKDAFEHVKEVDVVAANLGTS
ncbi:hypothetical protein B0H19DRAFT_1057569 [Mycena capillaripes]|nr:hypothetical protein B0H19DRAFT_1057569 [Mycena capillaripes]